MNETQTQPKVEQKNLTGQSGTKLTIAEPQGSGAAVEEQRAEFWQIRFGVADSIMLPKHQKWGEWYKMMYAQVDPTDMAAWRSKVFLPILAGKVWDLISRFIQYKPGWEVSVRSIPITMNNQDYTRYIEEMNTKYDKVKLKMEYDYDNPLRPTAIADEINSVMLDACVTGTGLARVPYDNKKVEDKEHITRGDMVDLSLEQITTSHKGFNGFKAVNIFNVRVAPGTVNLQEAGYLIIKDYVPISTLQDRENYKNLDNIVPGNVSDPTAQYQKAKDNLLSDPDQVAQDKSLNLVETFECYDLASKMVTVYVSQGGNWVEVFRQPNIYWHGKYPFVAFYVRRKPHQFWGESLFENSETLQTAMNDVFNHYLDQWNMTDGMMAIEEGSSVEPFIVEPGGEFRYRGEAPKQWKFPEPNPAQVSTISNQILQVIEQATISNYASGAANSSIDKTQGTATGITRLMEAAAEKVGMMRSNFRRSFNEVGNMWLSNTQQFMDEAVPVKTKKNGQETTEVVRPIDVTGLFNLKIDDGSYEPVSKDETRKNFMDYIANITAWSKASVEQAQRTNGATPTLDVDFVGIAARGSEVYGENVNNFLLTPTNQSQDPMLAEEARLQAEQQPEDQVSPEEALMPAEAPKGAGMEAAAESVQPVNSGIAQPQNFNPQMAFA